MATVAKKRLQVIATRDVDVCSKERCLRRKMASKAADKAPRFNREP